MTPWLPLALYALFAYLLGAIPTGFWLVKALTGEDIRTQGSGSTGTTNVRRAVGGKWALLVLAIDILKGFSPVWVARYWVFPEYFWAHVAFGLLAIIGHSFSIFIGGKGGKSAATCLGVIIALSPEVALAGAVVAYGVSKLTRMVSVGTLSAACAIPALLMLCHVPQAYVVYGFAASLYIIFTHRENIARILAGTENKLT